jgi:4-amino-4-deoxy-L-arabinose transferase-like glycosyltransferase/mRNA-degrading endonuclease RelE of RelBE toxin-antitoxin system
MKKLFQRFSKADKFEYLFIFITCIIGLLLRLHLLLATDFLIDSDEAIVGLMAKHFVEGKPLTTFYYGQHYMGSLEPIIVAILFLFTGVSAISLKVVPLLFSIILIPLVYLITKISANQTAARFSAILMAIPPVTLIEWSGKARGGFMEIVVIITLSIYLCFYWSKCKGVRKAWYAFIVGLCTGIGWWVNNQIIFVLPAIGLFLLLQAFKLNLKYVLTTISVTFIGFIIGSLPFWLYNINNNFASFGLFTFGTTPLNNFYGLFEIALPILLGARRSWQNEDIFTYSSILVYFIYILLVIATILYSYKYSNKNIFLKVILFIVPSILTIFVLSSFGSLSIAPRYLLPLYPFIFIIAGVGISYITNFSKFSGYLLLLVIVTINLLSTYKGGLSIPGTPFAEADERVALSHDEIIKWLNSKDIRKIKTNYWIGYRIAFESNETIIPELTGSNAQTRISWYNNQISNNTVIVLTPKYGEKIIKLLKESGYKYKVKILSGYKVIYDVTSKYSSVTITDLKVAASVNSATSNNAIDLNPETRWGSSMPQNPLMKFFIELNKPEQVSGIGYVMGKWSTDFPREFKVICKKDDDEFVLAGPFNGQQLRDIEIKGESIIYFEPKLCSSIILAQTGTDLVFDWSIAEISVRKKML